MAMPKQVELVSKELDELEQQMKAPAVDGETEEAHDQPDTTPIAEVTPTQPVEQVVPDDTWEQKYRTLEGKYSSEVPRLHAQVKELMGNVQLLQQQLAARPGEIEEPEANDRLVTDRDREAFGEDLIDLQRRVAQEVAGKYDAKLQAYETKIALLEQRLMQTGNQVGEMTFEQKLHRAVPDFDAINTDPRWIAWLNEFSPEIRGPRIRLAEQAYNAGDVEGVKHYVDLFRRTIETPKADTRKTELERQVAPTRNASNGNAVAPQGKTYSMPDWNRAFDRVAVLVSKGRFEEAQKLEAELSEAMQQGRVTA